MKADPAPVSPVGLPNKGCLRPGECCSRQLGNALCANRAAFRQRVAPPSRPLRVAPPSSTLSRHTIPLSSHKLAGRMPRLRRLVRERKKTGLLKAQQAGGQSQRSVWGMRTGFEAPGVTQKWVGRSQGNPPRLTPGSHSRRRRRWRSRRHHHASSG
jgi:hypothetical protein